MIRNIVFDMGNVLIRFDKTLFVDRLGFKGEEKEILIREIFESEDWVQLDWGNLTEAEALVRMKKRIPETLHEAAERLVLHWDEPLVLVPGMTELIGDLKERGYHIYLLSNASYRQHEYWERIPSHTLFEGTVISADERIIKPEPAIYEALYKKFELKPEECLFVDDVQANVNGAKATGMEGFLFRNNPEELRTLLLG